MDFWKHQPAEGSSELRAELAPSPTFYTSLSVLYFTVLLGFNSSTLGYTHSLGHTQSLVRES